MLKASALSCPKAKGVGLVRDLVCDLTLNMNIIHLSYRSSFEFCLSSQKTGISLLIFWNSCQKSIWCSRTFQCALLLLHGIREHCPSGNANSSDQEFRGTECLQRWTMMVMVIKIPPGWQVTPQHSHTLCFVPHFWAKIYDGPQLFLNLSDTCARWTEVSYDWWVLTFEIHSSFVM